MQPRNIKFIVTALLSNSMSELSLLKCGGFVLLTVQQVMTVLLLWWGKKSIPSDSQYIPSCMVVVSEFGKLVFSILLFYMNTSYKSIKSFLNDIMYPLIPNTRKIIISIVIPSFFYCIQSNLLAAAFKKLDPITFQVGCQLKLVVYVVISRMFVDFEISDIQFLAVLMLIFGVAMVSSNRSENESKSSLPGDYLYGLVYISLASFASGLTGVIIENSLREEDFWMYSIQSSAYAFIFSLLIACFQDSDRIQKLGFFHGFDHLFTWSILAIYLCGGLLAALVIKYMGSIWRGFSSAFALIIQTIIQYYIKDGSLNRNDEMKGLFFGLFLVIYASMIYTIFAKQKCSYSLKIIENKNS